MIAVFAARYWSHIALALALLASWHFHHRLLAVHAEFDAFRASVKAASAQAALDQQTVNHAPAAASQAIAEKSDAQSPAYYAAVRAAAERMRRDSTRCPSPTDLPRADHIAPVNDGPGVDANMVSITAEEYQHYNENTARLAKVRQDALELIAAGVAVPNPSAAVGGAQ